RAQDGRIFIVGRCENTYACRLRETWKQLDRRLRTADSQHRRCRSIGTSCRLMQGFDVRARRQRAPAIRQQFADRIRAPLDPGRKIDPVVRQPAEPRERDIEISTVIRHRCFPSGADLTFATLMPRSPYANVKSKAPLA